MKKKMLRRNALLITGQAHEKKNKYYSCNMVQIKHVCWISLVIKGSNLTFRAQLFKGWITLSAR